MEKDKEKKIILTVTFFPLSSSNQADCWKFIGNLLPASLDFIATGSEDDDEDASVPTAVS